MSDTTDATENKCDADRAFLLLVDPVNGKHHGQIYDQVPDKNMEACITLESTTFDDNHIKTFHETDPECQRLERRTNERFNRDTETPEE